MRLSRTDFVPLLAIMAGGVIGASLSFSFLGRSPANDVPPVTQILYGSSATVEDKIEVDPVEISLVGPWAPLRPDIGDEPRVYARMVRGKEGTARIDLSFRPDVESQERALFYVDGVPFGSSDLSLEAVAIESVEAVSGDAAVRLYGARASAGVIQITLKEDRLRR